jgi:gamma-glutamylputrescine oxidase
MQSRAMTAAAPQGYYAFSADALPPHPRLIKDVRADVCVVGGGYTGLSAAVHLAEAGATVVLVEGQTVGFAASGRNGGQIHPGHRKTQAELEVWLGRQHARDLWDVSEKARHLVFDLAGEDCDLKRGLVIAAHDEVAARELAVETDHLCANYGYSEARMLDDAQTEETVGTSIYPASRMDMGGGHLHPLKFAHRLAAKAVKAGATIHEDSSALNIEADVPHTVRCALGKIDAAHVILACDAFSAALAPRLAPFIAHVESFIVATAPLGDESRRKIIPSDAAVADTRHVLDYYRKSADSRLLFAGREAYWNPPRDIVQLVRPRMLKVFPALEDIEIEYGWSGTVGITRTRMPHFGKLGPRLYFAHGYSGHGVALATQGGKVLADAVQGNAEQFDVLAHVPARKFPGGTLLRKPMVTAALLTLKLLDSI